MMLTKRARRLIYINKYGQMRKFAGPNAKCNGYSVEQIVEEDFPHFKWIFKQENALPYQKRMQDDAAA